MGCRPCYSKTPLIWPSGKENPRTTVDIKEFRGESIWPNLPGWHHLQPLQLSVVAVFLKGLRNYESCDFSEILSFFPTFSYFLSNFICFFLQFLRLLTKFQLNFRWIFPIIDNIFSNFVCFLPRFFSFF